MFGRTCRVLKVIVVCSVCGSLESEGWVYEGVHAHLVFTLVQAMIRICRAQSGAFSCLNRCRVCPKPFRMCVCVQTAYACCPLTSNLVPKTP